MAEPESFFKRLTRIFKSGPAVHRRVKGRDSRNYYGTQMTQGNYGYRASAPFGFGRENSPFSILGSYGILDRMARYAEFCFFPDTLIYTNNGVFTIKELAEKYKDGEIFHVWSYDHKKKTVVLATAHHPRITKNGKKQKIVKVVLNDGSSIKTTLDHKFMLRDGSYLEAKDLKENMALMPFNMRKYTGNYHQIYLLNKKENKFGWGKEHVMVAEYFANRKLSENEVVHHEDFDPENNCINNLRIMEIGEHKRYHANLNNRNKLNKRNKSHSLWMKKNNPIKRNDVTFDSIFDTAVAVDFSMKKIMDILDTNRNIIRARLREVGFKDWNEFRDYRGELQKIRCASRILEESTRPLNIKTLKKVALEARSIYEASSILGCSESSIKRFLKRKNLGTWSQLKKKPFDPGVNAKNFLFDGFVTYQDICNAYIPGMTRKELAIAARTTVSKIVTRLEREGYFSYVDWCKYYKNHKVKSIEFLEEESIVYNLTVDGHHNLAVGDFNSSESCNERPYSMVFVRQSEMNYQPEISTALDLFAEETVGGDDRGKCFHIYSDSNEIKTALDELFYDVLNVEFNLKPWVRNLVQYGDFFLYNEVHPEDGVINVIPIPVNEIEREEGFDIDDPYAIRYKWLTRGSKYLENWQVTHLRLLGNDLFLPYGTSMLESSRRTWRQLMMLEDSMLVYRVVRSPERRVFYIDVGNIEPNDVPNYMEAAKATLRSRDILDKSTGREDHRLNALAMTDDYFIPVRGPQAGTRVDTLQGGQNTTAIEDVEYIQRKLFAGLKVPKPYLNFDENLCLLGDTEIPILLNENKKEHTNKVKIQDLAKLEKYQSLIKQGKLWVYSTNLDGTLVPGKVKNCWETKKVKSSLRITLDNGDKIDCTENHPFLLREGIYVRADELKPNDSLMPLYRKISDKKKGSDKLHGYEMVWDNAAQKWIYTHQMVAKGSKIDKEQRVLAENIQVVHHKDFNKLNNSPENLILMGRKSHGKLHGKLAKKYLLSPEGIAKLNEARKTKEFWEKHQKGIEKAWSNEKQANKRKKIIAETNRQCNKIEKMHSRLAQLRKEGFMSGKSAPNYKVRPTIEEVCRAIKKGTVKPYDIKTSLNCSTAGLREVIREHANTSVFDFVRKYIKTNNLNISYKTWNVQVDFEELKSIAFCSKNKTEFYYLSGISRETFTRRCKDKGIIPNKWLDLYLNKHNHKVVSVEVLQHTELEPVYDLEIEKYHNFAVNSGIFVHNSAKASLAQMDVRFSRTIQSLQKVIVAEMNKLAMIHLFSMNFDGQDLVNFELKLSNPSSVALQQKLELWSVKIDIAGAAKETKLVDERWIQRNILELTDPEVSNIETGLRKDRYREMEIEALEPVEEDETQPAKTTDLFDPTMYDIVGGDVPKAPPTEENDSFSPVSVTLDRVNGEEAFILGLEDSKKEKEEETGAPIEPTQPSTPYLNRHEKNRKRRVGAGRGRHNTAMPDMAAMLSPKNKYNRDIHGQRTEGAEYTLNKVLIDDDNYDHLIEIEPTLSREMKSRLQKLEVALGREKTMNGKNLLTEEFEIDFDEFEINQEEDELIVIEEIIKSKDSDEEVETIEEKTLAEILNDES